MDTTTATIAIPLILVTLVATLRFLIKGDKANEDSVGPVQASTQDRAFVDSEPLDPYAFHQSEFESENVNPATGLPTIAGIDAAGNPLGTNSLWEDGQAFNVFNDPFNI